MDLRVFDIEPDIGRHVVGLDWRQVRGNDARVGELVGHLDGPVANARGDVEDKVRIVLRGNGRKVQLAPHELLHDGALQRQPLLFLLVVWENVGFTSLISEGTAQHMDGGSSYIRHERRGRCGQTTWGIPTRCW